MTRLLLASILLLLAGCWPPPETPAAVAVTTAPVAETAPLGPVAITEEPVAVAEPLFEPIDDCGIPAEAIDLIIAFEVGSPQTYHAKYRHPIYPGGQSGTTIGFGTDLGYRLPEVILVDWGKHSAVSRLMTASGIRGPPTRDFVRTLADVSIELDLAQEVFSQTEVVEHLRLARRAFGKDQFCAAPGLVRGAIASVVFNRGASMSGPNRLEMRVIRDDCLPSRDWHCVAHQLRTMKRIWRGTELERGLGRRRDAEADLAERAA